MLAFAAGVGRNDNAGPLSQEEFAKQKAATDSPSSAGMALYMLRDQSAFDEKRLYG